MGGPICFFKTDLNYKPIKVSLPGPTQAALGKPFFNITSDDNTVDLFLKALSQHKPEDAMAYISKNFAADFDLTELAVFFETMPRYKSLVKIEFDPVPKNCRTNSILVMSKESNRNMIVHLHLIKEPDSYSNWKIYGIERE